MQSKTQISGSVRRETATCEISHRLLHSPKSMKPQKQKFVCEGVVAGGCAWSNQKHCVSVKPHASYSKALHQE